LNNLGVCYIKHGEPSKAARYWEKAFELDPHNKEVIHNVRRTLYENSRELVELKDSTTRRIRAMVAAGGNLDKGRRVWAFSPAVVPDAERSSQRPEPEINKIRKVRSVGANGTGFVVANGYVVTNRHVVRDKLYGTADMIQLSIPGSTIGTSPAIIVAIAKTDDLDLALLQCDQLNAPPLTLSTEPPRLGKDVMALGYPKIGLLGKSLKSTRGSILALPGPSDRWLGYDLVLNSGNSGGPLLGDDGNVVAVNTFTWIIDQPISGGVPSDRTIEFIADHLPDFTGAASDAVLDWADVAELGAKSTVLVQVQFTDAVPALAGVEGAQVEANYYSDPSCAHCRGWGKLACPHPKCSGGGILKYRHYRELWAASKIGIVTRARRKGFKSRCPTCSGANAIKCKFCRGTGNAR